MVDDFYKVSTNSKTTTIPFIMRFRTQTCKIILATSLIWFFVDVILLIYYTDCAGSGCSGAKGEAKGPSAESLVHFSEKIHQSVDRGSGSDDDRHNDVDFDNEGDQQMVSHLVMLIS